MNPVRNRFPEIRERCEELALYLIENQSTVRSTAERFGISKSTVHKDVSEKLPHINPSLATEVHILFEKNKSERHLRGGEATRRKYKHEDPENTNAIGINAIIKSDTF